MQQHINTIWCGCNCETLRISAVFAVVPCPFVCPSVCHVGGRLLFGPIASSFTFLISSASTQFQGKPFLREGGKDTGAMGKFCDFWLKSPRRCYGLTAVNDHWTVHKLAFHDVYSLWFSHRLLANPSWYIHINSVRKLSALFNNKCLKLISLKLTVRPASVAQLAYVCKRNIIGYSTWVRWVVSTNIMQFNKFEYHFACRRKDIHLCFIMSPGKMIFAVLEIWPSPLQWVLNS